MDPDEEEDSMETVILEEEETHADSACRAPAG